MRRPALLMALCIASFGPGLRAQTVIGEKSADPQQIARIFADEEPHKPKSSSSAAQIDKQLDELAASQTAEIGGGNPRWNSDHPQWSQVYSRIRADLASDLQPVLTGPRSDLQESLEGEIAARMRQSEATEILAYYDRPEGRRYQEFMRRIDPIIVSGLKNLQGASQPAHNPTQEEAAKYMRLLRLSRPLEAAAVKREGDVAAGKDTSGYAVANFMAVATLRTHLPELEQLNRDFEADLPGFEAFSGAAPMKHFFLAIEAAGEKMATAPNPVFAAFQASVQKHGPEWRALYLAASSP